MQSLLQQTFQKLLLAAL
ncbi:UNVERIFIED_CONTAM: hypothetical protein GTU68_009688 [Idotea baltica]|nr:hypothetical protein [Idotea baltica]